MLEYAVMAVVVSAIMVSAGIWRYRMRAYNAMNALADSFLSPP